MTQHNAAYLREGWEAGPWDDEPNGGAWTTVAGLLGCFIRHPRNGHLNGYVAVTPGHPWYGKSYDEVEDSLDVHGGITFAGSLTEPDRSKPFFADVLIDVDERLWWFGFDCHHWNDYAPGRAAVDRKVGIRPIETPDGYKPLAYVKAQVESLALQLAEHSSPTADIEV
jgi:hypothetical protein